MIAKPHFEKTNKCKNAMPFEKKIGRNFSKFVKKSDDLLKIKRF
jgi:hypothetical protein